MNAADVMVSNVITVGPDATVQEVAGILLKNKISAVPVISQSGKILGIVSESDMLRRVESHTLRHRSWWLRLLTADTTLRDEFVKSHSHKVVDVMTPKVLTVSPEAPLGEIASVLEKNGIKRVPVVKDGKLVGIVSRANLLQAIATIGKTIKVEVTADNATLREKVISQLDRQPLAWRSLINVIVHDGTVELRGMVDSESEKRAVRVAAEVTPGGASGHQQPDSRTDQVRVPMMSDGEASMHFRARMQYRLVAHDRRNSPVACTSRHLPQASARSTFIDAAFPVNERGKRFSTVE